VFESSRLLETFFYILLFPIVNSKKTLETILYILRMAKCHCW